MYTSYMMHLPLATLIFLIEFLPTTLPFSISAVNNRRHHTKKLLKCSYFDDISIFKPAEKRSLIGFSTDTWSVGQKKYKDFLAVNKMAKHIQKRNLPCVDIPLWEISQGPHYDDLQRLFESLWIPDMTSMDHFLLQYDLVIIPDPVLAK